MYYGHPNPSGNGNDFHQWEPVEVPEMSFVLKQAIYKKCATWLRNT